MGVIPKLMWLHFSSVNPFVLLVFTPGRAFPLAGCAPPLLQTPLRCGLAREDVSGRHSWSCPALTHHPHPWRDGPLLFLLSPPVPRLEKLTQVPSSKCKSLAALPQRTPKLPHSEGASGGGQELGLRIWLVV